MIECSQGAPPGGNTLTWSGRHTVYTAWHIERIRQACRRRRKRPRPLEKCQSVEVQLVDIARSLIRRPAVLLGTHPQVRIGCDYLVKQNTLGAGCQSSDYHNTSTASR